MRSRSMLNNGKRMSFHKFCGRDPTLHTLAPLAFSHCVHQISVALWLLSYVSAATSEMRCLSIIGNTDLFELKVSSFQLLVFFSDLLRILGFLLRVLLG